MIIKGQKREETKNKQIKDFIGIFIPKYCKTVHLTINLLNNQKNRLQDYKNISRSSYDFQNCWFRWTKNIHSSAKLNLFIFTQKKIILFNYKSS